MGGGSAIFKKLNLGQIFANLLQSRRIFFIFTKNISRKRKFVYKFIYKIPPFLEKSILILEISNFILYKYFDLWFFISQIK